MMIRFLRILLVAFAALMPLGIVPAHAQDGALAAAKAAGQVGERPDGLIGAVSATPSADIRALVDRINAQRMQIYAQSAQRTGASLDDTRRVMGERLVGATPAGQYYMDASNRWVRR
jgi:uncharacterized protein YdbL (DUF1318 family)